MTLFINRLKCCGSVELHGIQFRLDTGNPKSPLAGPLDCMKALAKYWTYTDYGSSTVGACIVRSRALVFFTQSTSYRNKAGIVLAEYIKENNLGTVFKTKPVINPNTRSTIQGFLWTVNRKVFDKKFALEQKNVAKTQR